MANEKRLIDANETINVFTNWLTSRYDGRLPRDVVAEIPTVDAVEVVRCGKCKWYDPDSEYCQFWHGVRHPGHYCGEGERKDNA